MLNRDKAEQFEKGLAGPSEVDEFERARRAEEIRAKLVAGTSIRIT